MGGLIGGLFGGGDEGGGATEQSNQTLQQNSQTQTQDPNAAVTDFQNRFVKNDGTAQQPQNSLNGMFQQYQDKPNNNYMAQRGGMMSFFRG